MTAKCQRNSCSLVSPSKPNSSFLYGASNSGFLRVTFSAASAALIRTRGSFDHKPTINLGKSCRFLETIVPTWSERPIDRRSPPFKSSRMFFGGIRKHGTAVKAHSGKAHVAQPHKKIRASHSARNRSDNTGRVVGKPSLIGSVRVARHSDSAQAGKARFLKRRPCGQDK
jgi:hypothetical protein